MSKTRVIILALFAGAFCFSLAGSAAGEPDRIEAVLAWDDGEPDVPVIFDGMQVAVEFQAPDWADLVLGAHVYIWSDSLPDVRAPHRETRPIRISVPGGGPGGAVTTDGGYPVQAWLEVEFPEPVDITDPAHFPDRWFFIAIEWLIRSNPVLGADTDDPIDGHSSASGGPFEEFDVMVRAVVADTVATPVKATRWGTIKADYR